MIHPALEYAERGYKVFPCAGKYPLTENGFYAGTTDASQIEKWIKRWPNCNWAIWTDGLLVVDCDPGSESWPSNPDQALDLAAAPTVITPRGGRHFYFRQPDGAKYGNTVKQIHAHVDTRGSVGYVVVPPSINDGKPYRWLCELETSAAELPEPPAWLLELLPEKRPEKAAGEIAETEALRRIPEGQRNDAMFRFACMMRGNNFTTAEIYGALAARNQERCDPPLPEDEIRIIANSAGKYPASQAADKAKPAESAFKKPIIVNLGDVTPKKIEWLWPQRIPLGKVTLIAGEPGQGKSTMVSDIAARVTTGRPWPDAAPNMHSGSVVLATPASVILLSAEDDVEDTILPRLLAAEAKVSSVSALQGVNFTDTNKERCFSLEDDLPLLEQTIQQSTNCRLIVIDPVSSFLGKTDSHKNAEVRSLIAPLAKLASQYRVAVVIVTHLSKGQNRKAMHAPTGSIAFVAAARAAWVVGPDKHDAERRLLVPIKTNLTKNPGGLAFRIGSRLVDGESVGYVEWEPGRVDQSADELLSDEKERVPSEVDACCEFLTKLLSSGGKPVKEIYEAAETDGFSEATVKRARRKAGIEAAKVGFQGEWHWVIPGQSLWDGQHATAI